MLTALVILLCLSIQHVSSSTQLEARLGSDLGVTPIDALFSRAVSASAAGDSSYTCGPGSPCSNGACCGSSGWCGYGPTYCGDGCQSNCDAVAECGEFAATAGKTCPLNVCCSQYGFCGTTEAFCGDRCQSGCTFTEPSSSGSNVQTRIIGYWESWNSQHACGTMPAGSIPVSMLTHLNVAFGYIDPSSYKISAMDGINSDIYRNIGNVKAQNTNLKISIAIGGWTFTDPGAYRSVFTTMVSSPSLRSTFINNLLGFLGEYGYDGVDFDWEYPGADDRGGNSDDGVNYTQLLKELQTAISSSGKQYIVTFTAPTSYWYLRHFDLANMVQYVDWVNLMSYDLHGVWDSSNPIGNQVLAHTNLTEIDDALDLFWRVNVDPSKIVLGLGFYGRSFALSDASCWQPGCAFSGAGAAGACTATPGILSYYEIQDILASTGASAYLDEKAAVKYMVYGGNNWISYDDATTFKLKIDFANKKGLGGLMVWAVDQDDPELDALRAISDSAYIQSSSSSPPIDLTKIFPSQLIPSSKASKYGLVNIGSAATSGETNPGKTGIGFFLITSDSYATTSLRKRAGDPEPFTFINCPMHVLDRPVDEPQTARVICLNENVEDCFRIMERGVEGTMVEMPDNCAPNSIGRAISLTRAPDQYLPDDIQKRKPTSEVYDFTFDFNFDLMRRDTNLTSVRMDYSNYGGYWDQVVNSDGIQDTSSKSRKRYFAPNILDWKDMYKRLTFEDAKWTSAPQKVSIDMSKEIFWETKDSCDWEGTDYGDGIGAWVQGDVNAQLYYGYTIIGERNLRGTIDWVQTDGFLSASGSIDLNFGLGGMGNLDISLAGKSNPAINRGSKISLGGSTITASGTSYTITFKPYYELDYAFATMNGSTAGDFTVADIDYNGLMTARVISDLGEFVAYYPAVDTVDWDNDARDKNKISIGSNDVLYSVNKGGFAAISSYLKLGVDATVSGCNGDFCFVGSTLPGIQITYDNMVQFGFQPGDSDDLSCSSYLVATDIYSDYSNYDRANWPSKTSHIQLASDMQEPSSGKVCFINSDASQKRSETNGTEKALEERASGKGNPWGLGAGSAISIDAIIANKLGAVTQNNVRNVFRTGLDAFACGNCLTCFNGEENKSKPCCGCVSMNWVYGLSDMPRCDVCDDVNTDGTGLAWPGTGITSTKRDAIENDDDLERLKGEAVWWLDEDEDEDEDQKGHFLAEREPGKATRSYKWVTVCKDKLKINLNGRYPAFPNFASWPWDGIEDNKFADVSAYWGNTSADCADWSVGQLTIADTDNTPGGRFRTPYDTEHVFEGQLIGDFFNQWLPFGQVTNQMPAPSNPQPIRGCDWTDEYIKDEDNTVWTNWDGNAVAFIDLLLQELGNLHNLDRLTILQRRPNQMKGRMFSGISPSDMNKYAGMSNDAQLQATKEMGMSALFNRSKFSRMTVGVMQLGKRLTWSKYTGMVFTYLNDQTVWTKFCATYEGIYSLMAQFDVWYATQASAPKGIIMTQEWKKYINEVLSSMAARSEDTFWDMAGWVTFESHNIQTDTFYAEKWATNMDSNSRLLKITGTCSNL